MTGRRTVVLLICLLSFSFGASADSDRYQALSLVNKGQKLTAIVLQPMTKEDPDYPIAKAVLQKVFQELIRLYKDAGTIGPNDMVMEQALLAQAGNLDAVSVIIFATRDDNKPGEFLGMVRVYFPDSKGLLSAEKETLDLQRQGLVQMKNNAAYFIPDKNEWKAEIGSYVSAQSDIGPLLIQILVDELDRILGQQAHLYVQTAEGGHERTYSRFYGFNSVLGFPDQRIADRRSVIMETQLEDLRQKVRAHSAKRFLCESSMSAN